MTASGTDNVGKYTVKGTYYAKDSECMFKKQYEGFYAVYYVGTLNDSQTEITGYWGY